MIDALKGIGDLNEAANALKQISDISDDGKINLLKSAFKGVDDDAASAALGITNLGNSMSAATKQSGGLGAALKGMFAANPVGSIITSVTAVIGIISMIKNAYDQYKQGLIDQATEATTAWNDTTSSLEDYASKYQELRAQLDSGDLSEAETVSVKEQILDIQNQITDQYGEQAAGIDLVNGKLETQLGIIQSISSEEAAKNINNNLKAYEDAEYEMNKTRHYYLGSTGASIYGGGIAQEIYDLAKSAGIDLEENGPSEGVYNMYLDVNAEKADVALNDFITGLRDLEKQYEDQGLDIPYELSDVLSYTTGEFERNNEVLENYRDNYNAYLQQQMYEMDQGDLISKYSDAIENYNKALSEGDPSAIEEAKTAFEEADAAKNEFLSTGSNSKFSRIFDDLDGQLDTARIKIEEVRSVLEGGDFEGTWASKLAESISGIDLGEELRDKLKEVEDLDIDAVDVEVALNTDGVQRGEETIRRIAEILDFDLTSDEEVQALINLLVELGIVSDGTGVAVSDMVTDLESRMNSLAETSKSVSASITAAMEEIYAQSTGQSISYEDFTSEELADYTSALEYNNGALQLNADRVRELAKAKSEEQIAANDATKAEMQATYLDQATQIAELTQKLEENNFATGESADSIQSQIDALYSSNDAIAAQCTQIDVLNQGLREATGEYQNWLNAQNATETGDMFSDAVNAMQAIRDTANAESEDYGRIGTQKYMAAVEFVVPDSIDSEDSAAVQSYLDSISYALTRDEEGMITGLNLQGFLDEAVNQGLMTVTDGQYQIAGQMTMEQFAEGMNMSLPLVQAIFGELQEFTPGGEGFNWADEAYDNLGDAFVATEQSIAAMKQELDTLDPNVDTSRIEELNSQLQEAEATKEQLSGEIDLKIESSIEIDNQLEKAREEYESLKSQLENDPTNVEIQAKVDDAEAKIQQLESDKEALGTPTQTEIQIYINNIDAQIASIQSQIDQLSDPDYLIKVGLSEGEAATQISNLQTQMQSLEDKKVAVTGDTSDADSKMNAVEGEQIQDKHFSITANATQALNTLTSVRVSLSNIQSKTIDITTRYSSTGTPPATGAGSASGTAHATGTVHKYLKSHGAAYVQGNAKLQGDWGTDVGQRVLIGELGPEIVVDPRNGRWRTYGDNGAEFAYIPQDAIIFNHEQSKSLLERGFVNGRGTARAYGTAMVTGGISVNTAHKVTQAANNRNNSSTSSKTYDNVSKSASKAASNISDATEAADEFEETLDWIEIAIDRIERAIDKLSKTAGNTYELFTTRNNALSQQISKTTEEINLQQRAYDRYIQEANSVGLSEEWAVKVRNGLVDIEDITDENLKNLIDDYSKWYEKALDCADAIDDLKISVQELYEERFNNVVTEFDGMIGQLQDRSDLLDAYIDQTETKGYLLSSNYYSELMKVENQILSNLQSQRNAMNNALNEAVAAGQIKEYSESWYDMRSQIDEVTQAIVESETALIEYQNSIRQLQWDAFDLIQERVSDINDEAEFLMDLLDAHDMFDEHGKTTEFGAATFGLLGTRFNTYMQQADMYREEMAKLDAEIAKDPYNQTLLERRQELLELQRESISSAEDERDAIRDLISDGIDAQLESLQDLIDKYTDMLDVQKDIYDYQQQMAEQQQELSNLEKQLAAYAGDNSEEGRLKRQELQNQLSEARQNLEETQYDQQISQVKALLDDMYTEYETILNMRLDDLDQLVSDVINNINLEASNIRDTIVSEADGVGYDLTNTMETIWSDSGSIGTILSNYSGNFTTTMTTLQAAIDAIKNYVADMAGASDTEASGNIGNANSSTAPSQPSSSTSNTTTTPPQNTTNQSSSNSGNFFIPKRDTYPKGKLDINTSIVDKLLSTLNSLDCGNTLRAFSATT